MPIMEQPITYFETLDPGNTDITFRLARDRAHTLNIKKIVIASTSGATAKKAMEYFKNDGIQLNCHSPSMGLSPRDQCVSRGTWQRH